MLFEPPSDISIRFFKDRLLYYAFDLLYLDGFDLRAVRLAERKRVLLELLARASMSQPPCCCCERGSPS